MGSTTLVGFKKHTNAWGSGAPVAVGAGDGIEIESEGLALDVQFIENMGLSGQGTQLPGAVGPKLCAGDVPMPLYYRGPDLLMALAMGSLVAPVQQGSSAAYLHGMRLAASHAGLYGTLASGGASHPVVREWPHVKVNGFTLDANKDGGVTLTVPMIASDMHLNGADDDDLVVVSRGVVDRSLTIAAQPASTGVLTVTVTDADDSITELYIDFVGTDAADDPLNETYQLSVDTKSWNSTGEFKTVTSASLRGMTGTAGTADTVVVTRDVTTIVASTPVWLTTLTIAAQPTYPAPVSITVTDSNTSITELVVTFTGLDDDGFYATEAYTLSTDGLTWTSDTRWSSITSATMSGLTGASTGDTIKVGVANANDTTSYQSISFPTTNDYQRALFSQLRVYLNDQAGADFTDSDEIYPESIQIKGDPALKADKITTHFGNRIDEPTKDGFSMVTCSIVFPQWDAANSLHVRQRMLGSRQKVKMVFSGPLADTGYPLQYQFFLNNVQFTGGSPNVGGPGQIPLSMEGKAHRATANPTGLPAWADTQPISACVVNLRDAAMWS